jgi:hypothetical protein
MKKLSHFARQRVYFECPFIKALCIMLASRFIIALCLLSLLILSGYAADCIIPRERHAWAAFRPGSWKEVRVTSESLDAAGNITQKSVTQTKTTLLAVENDIYELQIDVIVEVDGRRILSEPKIIRLGLNGEQEGQRVRISYLNQQQLKLEQQLIPVQVSQLEICDSTTRKISRLYVSNNCLPHVLRRETDVYDIMGNQLSQTLTDTTVRDITIDILSQRHFAWKNRTELKHPQGTIITEETLCSDIPGSVIAHVSHEYDATGKLLKRSTLELLNYNATPPEAPRRRILRRNRRE